MSYAPFCSDGVCLCVDCFCLMRLCALCVIYCVAWSACVCLDACVCVCDVVCVRDVFCTLNACCFVCL